VHVVLGDRDQFQAQCGKQRRTERADVDHAIGASIDRSAARGLPLVAAFAIVIASMIQGLTGADQLISARDRFSDVVAPSGNRCDAVAKAARGPR
jgi:hypothetical protein